MLDPSVNLLGSRSARTPPVASAAVMPVTASPRRGLRRDQWLLGFALLGVFLGFGPVLREWAAFARGHDLYSHVLLVPAVSAYLLWLRRDRLPAEWARSPGLAALLFAAGIAALALSGITRRTGSDALSEDVLAPAVLACVLFIAACVALCCGRRLVNAAAFPLGFLLFTVPCPLLVRQFVESRLQEGSVLVASALFQLAGTPVLRHDLVLTLPGFTLEVAPQCSGLHSTLVLLLTALVAAAVVLRSRQSRLLLVAAVIPLALLRNGLRIFMVGELCIRIGPHMVHSDLHVRGGPLFFALSLVPFSALVWWLRRSEVRPASRGTPWRGLHLLPALVLGLLVAALLGGTLTGCSMATRKERLLRSAERFSAQGRYDQAEVEYLNVLRLDPRDLRATRFLGLVYLAQGRTARAWPFLNAAVRAEPADTGLRLAFGQVCLATGRVAEASASARVVLDASPDDPEAPLLLAEAALDPAAVAAARLRLTALSEVAPRAPLLVALAILDLRQKDLVAAGDKLEQARRVAPGLPALASALGGWHLARDDLLEAGAALRTAAETSPVRSPRRLQFARFLIQTGNLRAARDVLEAIGREAPDFLPVWIWLAEIALVEQRTADCAALVGRALARDPADAEARLLHARLQLADGAVETAVSELEQLAQANAASAQVHYHLALAQLIDGVPARAAVSLHRALQIAPGFADAILVLAGLNIRHGAPAAAVTPLRQLARERPKLTAARLLLAEAYRAQRSFAEARQIYQELETDFAANPQTPLLIGQLEVQQGRTDAARTEFLRALALVPDFLPAIEQLVALDLAIPDAAAALQRIDAALARQPSAAGLHVLRAQALLAAQRPREAELALRQAIRLQPDAAAAYYLLAQASVASGDARNALRSLDEVMARRPNEIAARLLAAEIHQRQGDYAAARQAYTAILKLNPRFSLALNNLAVLLLERFGELDQAQEFARKARAFKPADPHIADTLGWIFFRQQQYSRALPLLEESAARLDRSAEVQAHLGLARYFAGHEKPAREALARALALDEHLPLRDEIRPALAVLALDPAVNPDAHRPLLQQRIQQHPDDVIALSRLAAVLERSSPAEAEALYARLLADNPAHPAALDRLVALDRAAGQLPRAMERIKAARRKDPANSHFMVLLGQLAYESGDFAPAAGLLERVVRDDRSDPDALLAYGFAAYACGRWAAAEAAARDALSADVAGARAAEARVLLAATRVLEPPDAAIRAEAAHLSVRQPDCLPALMVAAGGASEGDRAPAIRAYERLLERYAKLAPAWRSLALLYAREHRSDDRALEVATAARNVFPDDAALAGAMGLITFQRGEFDRAKSLLAQATAAYPQDGELLWHLGMAQHKTNDVAAARATLERALQYNLPADLATAARGTAQRD